MVGTIPFLNVRSPLTGRRGVSLPFSDSCSPLCSREDKLASLTRRANKLAKAESWRYFEIRGSGSKNYEDPCSIRYYRHTLLLNRPADQIFDHFSPANKRAIRKSAAQGLLADQSYSIDSLKAYYRLHCQTRKRHGTPPQPWSFFRAIHENILSKNKGCVFLALDRHRSPVAGSIFFYSGSTAIYKFGASNERLQASRPNNFLFWAAIKELAKMGVEKLDYGRTSLGNEGLRRFKLSWGASESIIPYYRYRTSDGSLQTIAAQPSNWSILLFRRLPIPISRIAGRMLYKHVG